MFKRQKPGRPKGAKNKLTVEPGKEIIIPNSTYENITEQPETNVVEMSAKDARKLVNKIKRPHVFKSEETKNKMIEILKQGREKAKATLEEKKRIKEEEKMKQMKIIKIKETKKKKVLSPYANFMKHIHPEIKAMNPHFSFGDISREIGVRWKALSKDEKEQFKTKTIQSSQEDEIGFSIEKTEESSFYLDQEKKTSNASCIPIWIVSTRKGAC
jgi:hypothetical protein